MCQNVIIIIIIIIIFLNIHVISYKKNDDYDNNSNKTNLYTGIDTSACSAVINVCPVTMIVLPFLVVEF